MWKSIRETLQLSNYTWLKVSKTARILSRSSLKPISKSRKTLNPSTNTNQLLKPLNSLLKTPKKDKPVKKMYFFILMKAELIKNKIGNWILVCEGILDKVKENMRLIDSKNQKKQLSEQEIS